MPTSCILEMDLRRKWRSKTNLDWRNMDSFQVLLKGFMRGGQETGKSGGGGGLR